jgi:hypothetical protein
MVTSLPCGCELRRQAAFNRRFGLDTLDRRRSCFATTLETSGRDRSGGGRRVAGFSLRFEARDATCWIEHDFTVFWNIQDAKDAKKDKKDLAFLSVLSV